MKRYKSAVAILGSMTLLVSAAAAQRASVSAAEVNGRYEKKFTGKFRDQANVIEVLAIGGGKVRFYMNLLHPYFLAGGAGSANLGDLIGTAEIAGDTAVFASPKLPGCKMTLRFTRPGVLDVKQTGTDSQCEFGYNVIATGRYRKISSKKPDIPSDSP